MALQLPVDSNPVPAGRASPSRSEVSAEPQDSFPKTPPKSPLSLPRRMKDTRQAVKGTMQVDSPPLKPLDAFPLPPPLELGNRAITQSPTASEASASRATATCSSCLDGLHIQASCWLDRLKREISQREEPPSNLATPVQEPPRRWYRVHPISDELYFVRPDPGIAGRTVGHPDAAAVTPLATDEQPNADNAGASAVQSNLKSDLIRQHSVPYGLCRHLGLGEPSFNDTFVNTCKLCCDQVADVVILPCKHGGMCETCLRKTLFIRPVHRGGHTCPFCRKKIIEVIKLYDEGAIKQYGYAISAGCFFEGKDDN